MKVTNVVRTKIRIIDGEYAIYAQLVHINKDGTATYKLWSHDITNNLIQPLSSDERIMTVDEILDESNILTAWRLSNVWFEVPDDMTVKEVQDF